MRDGLRVTRAARARGLARSAAAAMESSFQRLGRGRRFRKKPADEAAASPPADGASAAAATAPRHSGFVAGEGTARARGTASAATPEAAAKPAAWTPRDEPLSSTEGSGSRPSRTDDYNAEPSRPLPGSTRPGLYGQTLVSFGLSDADDLFGGGVPLGSVVLIGADPRDDSGRRDCGNANTLVRYFLAEGVASKHAALWLSPGARNAKKSRAATLPREMVRRDDDEVSNTKNESTRDTTENKDDDGLRIAWQYRRYLRQGKALDDSRVGARGVGGLAAGVSATGGSEVPGSNPGKKEKHNTGGVRRLPSMCHAFDLTREAGAETARTADLRCAPFFSRDGKRSTSSASRVSDDDDDDDDDAILNAALDECVRLVERCDAASDADDDTAPVGRIVVQLPDFDDCAFGSDAYRASRADAEEATIARLTRFLRGLRGALRGGGGGRNAHATQKWKRVCAVVTYPLACLSPSAAASLVHAVDAAIELETLPERNADADAKKNETHAFEALLPDPNLCVALLRVRKLAFPGPGAVAPSPLTRMDRTYALQVRRKRLAVRPLRIAPEDAASGSDGKKEKTSTSLCGGGPADAPNALDF